MEKMEDLSFSGLVNKIQGKESKANDLLFAFASETAELNFFIENMQKELEKAEARKKALLIAGHRIAQHIKKELPCLLVRKKLLVELSETSFVVTCI